MTFSQRIAGDTIAICTIFLVWALLAPIVAGPLPPLEPIHTCPAPMVMHSVGSNLKIYTRTFDGCAQLQAGEPG